MNIGSPIYKSVIEFKSTFFNIPTLVISSTELAQIEYQLEEKIAQAPGFFKNLPLLIDLQNCNHRDDVIDFKALVKYLYAKQFIPIGICGGNGEQNSMALELNIPIHALRGPDPNANSSLQKLILGYAEPTTIKLPIEESEVDTVNVDNKFISRSIRSGQRVYSKGDLTILRHVNAGSEVMAEGNIHIYGTLRGRALAGVQGNTESRIFCSNLLAELVSIAGYYKISEELEQYEQGKPTQVFLQKQALIIEAIK